MGVSRSVPHLSGGTSMNPGRDRSPRFQNSRLVPLSLAIATLLLIVFVGVWLSLLAEGWRGLYRGSRHDPEPQPEAAIALTNLRPEKEYTFTIFASRDGSNDNREARYVIEGLTTDTVYLDAANNTDSAVTATVSWMASAVSSGSICRSSSA